MKVALFRDFDFLFYLGFDYGLRFGLHRLFLDVGLGLDLIGQREQ